MQTAPVTIPRSLSLAALLFLAGLIQSCGKGVAIEATPDAALIAASDAGRDVRGEAVTTSTGADTRAAPDASGNTILELPVQHKSGARLRALVYLTEPGEHVFLSWFDSILKTSCRAGILSDGSTVCVPTFSSYGDKYADPECKTPIFIPIGSAQVPIPDFVSFDTYTGCGKVSELYRPGPRRAVSDLYQTTDTGACIKRASAGSPDNRTMPLTLTRVDPKEFVAFRVERERPAGDRISRSRLKFDDGAEQVWGYFDETERVSCNAAPMSDGSVRCVPRARFSGPSSYYYSDATCTIPFFTGAPDPTCRILSGIPREVLADTGSFVEKKGQGLCDHVASFFEAIVPPSPTRYAVSGLTPSCGAIAGPFAKEAGALPGAAVSPGRLALFRSSLVGRGRLAKDLSVSQGGLALWQSNDGAFWDRELGVFCTTMGGYPSVENRCVPDSRRAVSRAYLDAACTKPVALDSTYVGCGARGVDPRFMAERYGRPFHVWRLKNRISPEPQIFYEILVNGTCQGRAPTKKEALLEIGDEFPPAEMATLSVKRE